MTTLEQLLQAMKPTCRVIGEAEQLIGAVNNSPAMSTLRQIDRQLNQVLKSPEALELAQQIHRFLVDGFPVAPASASIYYRWGPPSEPEDLPVEPQPEREFGLKPAHSRKHGC